jgi:hypothetical protein
MSTRSLLFAIALLGATALVGCGPDYDRTEISGVIDPPGGEINHARLVVPQGTLVKAHIVPFNDDDEPMSLQVRSANPDLLEVAPTINDHDFVFLGKRLGSTTVELKADGKVVLVLDATVSEQPSPE